MVEKTAEDTSGLCVHLCENTHTHTTRKEVFFDISHYSKGENSYANKKIFLRLPVFIVQYYLMVSEGEVVWSVYKNCRFLTIT